jgi:hypothetical protein
VGDDECACGTSAKVAAECECADRAWKRVRGEREADEQAELAGRRGPHREPRDRDDAHPVAERQDAEPGQQPPGSAVSEQHAIRVRDHVDVMC